MTTTQANHRASQQYYYKSSKQLNVSEIFDYIYLLCFNQTLVSLDSCHPSPSSDSFSLYSCTTAKLSTVSNFCLTLHLLLNFSEYITLT